MSSIELDATEFAITLSALLDGFAIQIALDDPVVDPQRAFTGDHAVRLPDARIPVEAQKRVVPRAARTRQKQASR